MMEHKERRDSAAGVLSGQVQQMLTTELGYAVLLGTKTVLRGPK